MNAQIDICRFMRVESARVNTSARFLRRAHWSRLQSWSSSPLAIGIRPFRPRDRAVVLRDLGPVLTATYPRGSIWLNARLADIADGHARGAVSIDRTGLQGITIETPKGANQSKLSTIWVAPRARGRGLGGGLADRCVQSWIDRDIEQAWVTVASELAPALEGLLLGRGFRVTAFQADRYGPGRDEVVLTWSKATAEVDLFARAAAAGRSARMRGLKPVAVVL